MNATEREAVAAEFAASHGLNKTADCAELRDFDDSVACVAKVLAEKMGEATTSADGDWREKLAAAVSRVAAAGAGFAPEDEVTVVLSGSADKLAWTLESFFER